MIKIDILIFGICLKLDLHIHRAPKNADKCDKPVNAEEHEEMPIYEDNPTDYLFDENAITQIANQFEQDLKKSEIYDIPQYSDVPKRYAIQDDVEIITDGFEKEIEDIIEGRR